MGSEIIAPGSGIRRVQWDLESRQPQGQGSKTMGSGLAIFLERGQAVPFLWDQGPKFVKLFESRIRNLGTKMHGRDQR